MSVYTDRLMQNLGDWLRSIREQKMKEQSQRRYLDMQKEMIKWRQQLAEEQRKKTREEYLQRMKPLFDAINAGDISKIKQEALKVYTDPLQYQRFMNAVLQSMASTTGRRYDKKGNPIPTPEEEQLNRQLSFLNNIIMNDPDLKGYYNDLNKGDRNAIIGLIKGLAEKGVNADLISSYFNALGVPQDFYTDYLNNAMPFDNTEKKGLFDRLKDIFGYNDTNTPEGYKRAAEYLAEQMRKEQENKDKYNYAALRGGLGGYPEDIVAQEQERMPYREDVKIPTIFDRLKDTYYNNFIPSIGDAVMKAEDYYKKRFIPGIGDFYLDYLEKPIDNIFSYIRNINKPYINNNPFTEENDFDMKDYFNMIRKTFTEAQTISDLNEFNEIYDEKMKNRPAYEKESELKYMKSHPKFYRSGRKMTLEEFTNRPDAAYKQYNPKRHSTYESIAKKVNIIEKPLQSIRKAVDTITNKKEGDEYNRWRKHKIRRYR